MMLLTGGSFLMRSLMMQGTQIYQPQSLFIDTDAIMKKLYHPLDGILHDIETDYKSKRHLVIKEFVIREIRYIIDNYENRGITPVANVYFLEQLIKVR